MTPEQRDRYIALARTITLPDPDADLAVGWKLTHVDGTTRNRTYQWRVVLPGDKPVLHVADTWQDDNNGLCFAGAGEKGEFQAVQSGGCRIGAAIGHILVYPANLARSDEPAKHRAPWVVQAATFDPVHVLAFADLTRAGLTGAHLPHANLAGANLTGASLNHASLIGVDLTDATLAGANLTHTNLAGANLTGADLSHTSLSGAILPHASLSGANLTSANLADANFTGAHLAGAVYDASYLAELGWIVNGGWVIRRAK